MSVRFTSARTCTPRGYAMRCIISRTRKLPVPAPRSSAPTRTTTLVLAARPARRSACPSRVECLPCQGERSGCGNDSPPSPRPDGARRRSCAAACSSLSVSCRCFCRPMGVLGRVFEMVTVVILTPRRELMGYDRNRRSHDGLPSTRLWTIRRRGYSGRHSRATQQREDMVKITYLPVILQRKIGLRNTTCDFRAIEWAHSFWRNRLWARN